VGRDPKNGSQDSYDRVRLQGMKTIQNAKYYATNHLIVGG